MREPRYITHSGEVVAKESTSRHHIFGYEYEKGAHRRLRMLGEAIVRMHNPSHLPQYPESLHANVRPPIVPSMLLAEDMHKFLESENRNSDPFTPEERLEHLIQHLGYLSFSSPRQRTQDEAGLIRENLLEQLPYIHEGSVYRGL